MLVNVNTDANIRGSEKLREHITATLEDSLEKYADRITRVEVSLTDENSAKKEAGDDLRCLLEARLAGMQPVVMSCDASGIDVAVDGAIDKLLRLLDSRIGKREQTKGRVSYSGDGLTEAE